MPCTASWPPLTGSCTSHDSLAMSEGGRNKRGPGPSTWLYIASRGRVVLAFQKQRLGGQGTTKKKIETLGFEKVLLYIIKTAPALQGLRLAAGASGRQARSLWETSVVWLRQSAAHNWPVTSTQQDSIHAQARQESTPPFGNIQIFTRFSLLVTVKKAYSRLFTNSILGYGEGTGGLAWRWDLQGQSGHSSPQGPRRGPLPRPCKALDFATGIGI